MPHRKGWANVAHMCYFRKGSLTSVCSWRGSNRLSRRPLSSDLDGGGFGRPPQLKRDPLGGTFIIVERIGYVEDTCQWFRDSPFLYL